MAESKQDLLRSAWLEGKSGALSGREQAKAWALREIWRDAGKAEYGTGVLLNRKIAVACQIMVQSMAQGLAANSVLTG